MRVIVYGVHTLNKPTLDKPGVSIYDSQCGGECSINAGIWSFTDWKVNNGDKIKACALNTATSHQSCGYGSADKSRTDTIYIPVSVSTQIPKSIPSNGGQSQVRSGINWLQLCKNPVVDHFVTEPCETLTSPDGYILTQEGKRVVACFLGAGVLLAYDKTGTALEAAQEIARTTGICS